MSRAGALLEADARRIGHPAGEPTDDRAPDSLAAGTPEPLRSELVELLGGERVLARAIDLIRYASDASPYRRLPAAVVMAHGVEDVAKVLRYARRTGMSVNFRGAGTSLNGQAQTDGIMVDVRQWFSGVRILDAGARVRVKPGTVLGMANRLLDRHGYRLGPDPASKDTATIGGVLANNSGGMRCGVTWDSYSTVESMTIVLASGTIIDTADADAEQRFASEEPELARGLLEIRAELLEDRELAARVRRKYEIKNVTGYRLCAFLDAETPLEIFRRLLIGSEGTLGFIAEAVMRTRPEPPCTTLAWAHFANIDDAAAAVPALVEAGARATELMVAPALIAAAWNMPGTPEHWRELPFESASLIIEFGGASEEELEACESAGLDALSGHALIAPAAFTREEEEIEMTWRVREGLFGLVGRLRPLGSALIIEDVCVRPERIAECARDLQALLGKHEFLVGVAGHASAGNLHFQLTPGFEDPADLRRYEAFMGELVELIVDKYDGSLKAEHGTGVNMAPYVEREWGAKATEMMWRVKALADPQGVLNPGSVLSRDPGIHLKHLKSQPEIEQPAAHLCRVRVLRAGLPVAQRDDHSASADRDPAGDGEAARGLARLRVPDGRLRARRDPDVCHRRDMPGRLPGRDRYGSPDEAVPPARADRARGGRRARHRQALLNARAGGASRDHGRAGRRGRARRETHGRDTGRDPHQGQLRPRARATREPPSGGSARLASDRAGPARSRSTSRRASIASSGTPTERPTAPRCPRRSSLCQLGRASPCGYRRTRRATVAARRGARRDTRGATPTWRPGPRKRCGDGATADGSRS